MKSCIDFNISQVTFTSPTPGIIFPVHYYPAEGMAYDYVGNHIGSATEEKGKLTITPE